MSLKWIGDIDIPEGETSSIRLNIKCERQDQRRDAERGGGGGGGGNENEERLKQEFGGAAGLAEARAAVSDAAWRKKKTEKLFSGLVDKSLAGFTDMKSGMEGKPGKGGGRKRTRRRRHKNRRKKKTRRRKRRRKRRRRRKKRRTRK